MSLQSLIHHVEAFLGLIPDNVGENASVVVQLPAGAHTELANALSAVKSNLALSPAVAVPAAAPEAPPAEPPATEPPAEHDGIV